jgi:glutamate N-acetyltransferase/amino-acid N-acetyltransferase
VAVNLVEPNALTPVPGVRLAAVRTGIKDTPRDDLALAVFDEGTVIAGVYTQSAFAAPPVDLAKERVTPRAWIVNSGNANAATGQPGRADAIAVCEVVAQELGLQGDDIQPFSTGVIGERLDVARINAAVPALVQGLSSDHWLAYGRAIMTTDTVTKAVSKRVRVDGSDIIVTGVAKGSGMIKPNMATMLAYIASNATVVPEVLDRMVQEVANESFNRITVDGDTSTNDCFMLAATGKSEMAAINSVADERYPRLKQVVLEVAQTLAQAIVRDGEGATKFVTVTVAGGEHPQECLEVAYTVAESPLVKTALFAGDANWGRFCMAIGRAEVAELDPSRVSLWLDEVQVASGGLMSDDYTEDAGASVLAQDEFRVLIDLGRGDASQTVWTTDLSYEYVRINAEYRS